MRKRKQQIGFGIGKTRERERERERGELSVEMGEEEARRVESFVCLSGK
jgi:hypothetical protein